MANAQLGQKDIDCPDLDTVTAAVIAQLCRVGVVLPVGSQERKCSKSVLDQPSIFRARETLKQLLKDEPRRHDRFPGIECAHQLSDVPIRRGCIAPEGERPHARVHK